MITPPLALYVHFPWCVQKCPYCDFNSHKAPSELPEQRYIDALLEDLDWDLAQHFAGCTPPPLTSIFMGGGTPSLFSPDSIARLLQGVRQRLACAHDMEITLEANPGTIEHGRFADYRAVGINRVSLGAQSFDPQQLKKLGRIHDQTDIARAVTELRHAGIDNFNLDLMYGLSAQTLDEALQDLRQAIALQPTHISHYQLTLEPGTAFYHQPPLLPDDEHSYAMQVACQAWLAEAGYRQYEVSAYAQPGYQAAHNRNYWEFGDYLGLGAGAHGKLSRAGVVWRTERRKQPREYLRAAPEQRLLQVVPVSREQLPFEFMLNALRLTEGVASRLYEQRTGLAWCDLQPVLQTAIERELLETCGEGCRPTAQGRQFLNDLLQLFLPD